MLSEKEKKAIEELKQLKKDFEIVDKIVKDRDKQETKTIDAILNLIEKQKAEIEKKDKIIKAMAEEIAPFKNIKGIAWTQIGVTEYFTNKVEEENK